ncbi:hypothetical protein BU14_0106s0004 [Porphyra umbilicalis]|uniref:Secreted protein n=1 Tax=Porphyra umbilicalis TaxID=2786 RepID=A0A1X6PCE3_PORUM|nr:hypothetical protein BU14_0106s0004 [Porphyra umbilicalis]|eukprot:OSX78538.1 hypothetical protein BU14_0106s0004 [Porphyra umbilicalis]
MSKWMVFFLVLSRRSRIVVLRRPIVLLLAQFVKKSLVIGGGATGPRCRPFFWRGTRPVAVGPAARHRRRWVRNAPQQSNALCPDRPVGVAPGRVAKVRPGQVAAVGPPRVVVTPRTQGRGDARQRRGHPPGGRRHARLLRGAQVGREDAEGPPDGRPRQPRQGPQARPRRQRGQVRRGRLPPANFVVGEICRQQRIVRAP